MKKSIKRILILNILIAVFFVTQVMGATTNDYSFTMNATASASTLKPGDTVTITLGISNINAGELGINTLETQLSYDKDVFEKLTQEQLKSENNWSFSYNGSDNGGKLLGFILTSGVKTDQNSIVKIPLTVKSNVAKKETIIKFSEVTTNNGQVLITDTDKEIRLQIGENTDPSDDPTNTIPTPTPTPLPTNTTPTNTNSTNTNSTTNTTPTNTNSTTNKTPSSTNTTISTKKTDSTTSAKGLPSTGLGSIILIVIAVLILSAIFCAHKMKQY